MAAGAIRQFENATAAGLFAGSRRAGLNGFDPAMGAFVASRRELGASWGAIARMLQRSEHDTRLAFDPAYEPPEMLMRPKPAASAPEAETAAPKPRPVRRPPTDDAARPGTVRPGSLEAAALAHIADGKGKAREIAPLMGRNLSATQVLLQTLRRKGLATFLGAGKGYAVTGAGLKALMLADGQAEEIPAGRGVWAEEG